jgi:type IV pilus assembly protein PilB
MRHPFRQRRLVDVLADRGHSVPPHLAELDDDRAVGSRLVAEGLLTPEQWARAMAERLALPYADLEGLVVAPALFDLVPAELASQLGAIPCRVEREALEVAVVDPYDLKLVDRLEHVAGMPVRLSVTTPAALQAALRRSESSASVLKDVSSGFRMVVVDDADGDERTVSLENLGDADSPVVRLINTLLLDAIAKRASDIHIETFASGVVAKYRVDGVLYRALDVLDRRHHGPLISRLKVMAELDIAEKRVPQDGRFRLRLGSRDIDFRLSVIPAAFGEDVVIRVLDKSAVTEGMRGLRLERLGMAADVRRRFRRSIREPYGMVLITGPTGSGKTTTLYAALSELNAGEEKIITIEDPVEYQLDGIVQIPVNEKKGLTFARGLRSVLRHDPDKIMVGEIRDAETAQIAVQSALTGHLVFTTVHANNAFDVIGRFTHMGLDAYSFVSALNCVMAQRLVRLICPHCRRDAKVDADLLELSGLGAHLPPHSWQEGAGCEHCHHTGYRGRAAITEFLDLSPALRQMIVDRRPAAELQAAAVAEGMCTLRQSALAKARAGETTLQEINRVTFVE